MQQQQRPRDRIAQMQQMAGSHDFQPPQPGSPAARQLGDGNEQDAGGQRGRPAGSMPAPRTIRPHSER